VLGPDEGAPADTYRAVQILIPNSPQLGFTIDHPTPDEAGPNRNYKIPEVPPGAQITFHLQPQQRLYACAFTGQGFPSLLIEYLEDE
jgi:hypothetical protein